jgi:phage tail-like protein
MPEPCITVIEGEFTSIPIALQETWEAGVLQNLEFAEGGLRLRAEPGYREDQRFAAAGWNDAAAIAIDSCNQIYLLDKDGALWIYDALQQAGELAFGSCACKLSDPRGLAVSNFDVFVSSRNTVRALSRVNGQVRWIWQEPFASPTDVVFLDDRLYVLDRRQIVVLGPAGNVERRFGEDILVEPSGMTLGGDGFLYVLQEFSVLKFDAAGTYLPRDIDLTTTLPRITAAAIAVDEKGILYIGDRSPLTQPEETRRIYRLVPGADWEPLFGYSGPALKLGFDRDQNLFVVAEDGTLVRLKLIVSYVSPVPPPSFLLPPIDSGTPFTQWHKLMFDGTRPLETTISIRYLVRNGSTPPTLAELQALSESQWSGPLTNFDDALLDNARGRFLVLRGEVATNNPQTTPSIRMLTAVLPRQSYLRYLPATYQEDQQSKAFLERFLSIFETLVGRLDAAIDDTPRNIDPVAAPPEFRSWLSGWLAFGFEEGWSEDQRRTFLATAMDHYRQRGTREGISRTVESIINNPPIIVESFQFGCIEDPAVRSEYEQLYGKDDCHFCLLVDLQTPKTETKARTSAQTMTMIRRMVQEQIPAHTGAGILEIRPWFHLGFHTYLEVNTRLQESFIRLEESILGGGETALTDRDRGGRLESKARIGADTTLT